MGKVTVNIEFTLDPQKIECVARMMAHALGRDPDEIVPSTTYDDGRMVPYWHLQVEQARRFIAGYETMRQIEAV